MRWNGVLKAGCWLGLGAFPAWGWALPAQPAAPVEALLQDDAQLAAWLEDHSRELGAARARVAQAQSDVDQAGLWLGNPAVNGNVANWPLGSTNPANLPGGVGLHQNLQFNVGVSQTFEVAKRGPRMRGAQFGFMAEQENYTNTLGMRMADARLSLARVIHLKLKHQVLQDGLEISNSILGLEETRFEKGDLSGNDYDRLLLDTMQLRTEAAQNSAEYADALGQCATLLLASCEPAQVDLALFGGIRVPSVEDVDAALAARPDLRAAELLSHSATEVAVLEGRKAFPDPTVSLGYTHDRFVSAGNNPNTVMMGVTLPLPLFDRGQHTARKAQMRAMEIGELRAAALAQAQAQWVALRSQRVLLENALTSLKKDALPHSARVLDNTLVAFKRGQLSLTDFLLARRTHTALQLKLMDLEFANFGVLNETRRVLGVDAQLVKLHGRKTP